MTTHIFQNIIDAMPLGAHIYRADDNGALVFVGYNQAANDLTGFDNNILLEKKVTQAFPDLIGASLLASFYEADAAGESWSREMFVSGGGRIEGMFRIIAFRIGPGSLAALFEDISRHSDQETHLAPNALFSKETSDSEVRELRDQLVYSGKQAALGELTAGLAHELSQPLNGIKIIAQGLLRELVKHDLELMTLGEKLLSVVELTTKMGDILQHMRVFSQDIAGPASEATDAKTIVKNALIFFEQQMLETRVSIIKDFSAEPLAIMAVDTEIEQVVVNLLSNARYALMKSGKREKQLIIRVQRQGDLACIAVEDNGTGMSLEIMNRLFTPFFTTKAPGDGAGLALSVSKKIIEKNGGRIEVDTKQGEYSRFSLLLPLAA